MRRSAATLAPATSKAAFIGLGAIGKVLAGRVALAPELASLSVFQRRPQVGRELAAAHAGKVTAAADVAEAVRGAEVVFTCLPRSSDVKSVADAAIAGRALAPGSVWIDCTSGDPTFAAAIAAMLDEEAGCTYVDAAVSGGPAGAAAGTLTAMLGAPEGSAHMEHARPLVAQFAKNIVHCGPVGSGFAIKAVNNAMMAAHILIAAEGLTALKQHNVPPEVALAAINGSSGRSWATLQRIPDNVLSRKFDYNFSLELLHKDVQTCMSGVFKADDQDPSKAGFPLLTLGAERVAQALEKLGGEADHTEIVKLSEEETGTVLDRP